MEIALGFLMRAAFGLTTVIDGLAVIPTTPPSMAVSVGPGSIITLTTVDTLTSGFGSLAVDNTNSLVKIGINLASTTMATLVAPPVAGQSQNWLVEAQFLESDGSPVILPYYDAANPAVTYAGPANSGTPSNTIRSNIVQLQWRGGTPAVTGTQNTPVADVGWTPVALVTLANGQGTITSSSIAAYSGAPYVPTKLPQQRIQLLAPLNIYVSPTGNDVNASGLTPASPFATLQRAWTMLSTRYDLNNFQATINLANGTYSTTAAHGIFASGLIVGQSAGSSVNIVGNVASPSSVVVSAVNANCIVGTAAASVLISGMTLTCSGTQFPVPPCCITSITGSNISIGAGVTFGAAVEAHMYASTGFITINNGYTISGGAHVHAESTGAGLINNNATTMTIALTGTPAFSIAFINASLNSTNQHINVTYSGSATGARYAASSNAVISTGSGGNVNYFPGSVAGSASSGGLYF